MWIHALVQDAEHVDDAADADPGYIVWDDSTVGTTSVTGRAWTTLSEVMPVTANTTVSLSVNGARADDGSVKIDSDGAFTFSSVPALALSPSPMSRWRKARGP